MRRPEAAPQTPTAPDPAVLRTKRTQFGIVTLCIFAFAYLLNAATPFIADDYTFAFIFRTGTRVTHVADIIHSQRVFYFNQSGRVVSGFLTQLAVLVGKPVFNVANSMAFVLLVLLIYAHANGLKRIRVSLLLAIPLLLWFTLPSFGQSILWVAGSTNYMWMVNIVLAVLLPFRIHSEDPGRIKDNVTNAAAAVPFAVAAGWTNEAIGPTLVALMIVYIVYFKRTRIGVPKWAFASVLGACIGSALLIAAPGNWANLAAQGASGARPSLLTFADRALAITHAIFLHNIFSLVVVFVVCVLLARSFSGEGVTHSTTIGAVYLAAAFVAAYAMTLSPYFPARAWTGIVVLAVTGVGAAYSAIDLGSPLIRRLVLVVLGSMVVAFSVKLVYVYQMDIGTTARHWRERTAHIRAQRAPHRADVVVPRISAVTPYNAGYGVTDLGTASDEWPNQDVARYYGIRSIRAVDRAE